MHTRDKQFLSLLGITTLGMIIEFTMTFTDQVIVGRRLGEEALAAVGLAYPLDLTLDAFCAIFSSGAIVRYLSAQSSNNGSRSKDILSTALFLSILTGLLYGFTVWIFRWDYLSFFNNSDTIYAYGYYYLEYIAFSMMLQPISAFLFQLNWINDRVVPCVIASVMQLTMNIVFSWKLTESMGTAGAAAGTALGYLASVTVSLIAVCFSKQRKDLGLNFSYIESIAMIRDAAGDTACPIFGAVLSFAMSFVTVTYLKEELLPVTTLLVDLGAFMMIFEGISEALENTVGRAFAERDFKEIRKCMRMPIMVTVLLSCIASAFFLIFPSQVLNLLGFEDEKLIGEGLFVIRLFASGLIGFALFRVFDSYYAFIERPGISLLLTSLATLVIPVMGIFNGAYWGGFHGFVMGYCFAPIMAVIVVFLWLGYRYGWQDCPLLLRSTQRLIEIVESREHYEWRFGFTKIRLIVISMVLYAVITGLLWNYWTNDANYDMEFSFDLISTQLTQMTKAGMSEDILGEYVENATITSDAGMLLLLGDDGDTIEHTRDEYKTIVGHSIDSLLNGLKLTEMEFNKNWHGTFFLSECVFRKIKVGRRVVILLIEDFDVYWARNRSFYLASLCLFICWVVLLTVALRGSRKDVSLAKEDNHSLT